VTRLSQNPTHPSRAERRAAVADASRAGRRSAGRPAAGNPEIKAGAESPGPPRRSSVWWIAGVAVLALAAAGVWYAASQHPPAPAGSMLGEHLPDEGYDHVAVGSQIHYKANPPASGPHYPFPAPAGVYLNGLQTGFWVHSLEHGYIVLLYKPPASAERLADFDRMLREYPKSKYGNVKLLIVSYPDMPHPYAVLAWDWRLQMDSYDRATVLLFYKEHLDHGREDIP
jgi:hypothetical protein